MPLTKVIWSDYSHREHVNSIEELLARAEADAMFPYPYNVLASILEEKNRPTTGISVTQLVGKKCLRCQVLQRYEEYAEPVEAMFSRWRGTITHAALEKFLPKDSIAEVRFWTELAGLGEASRPAVLHGQVDLIRGDGIYDGKTTKRAPLYDKVWEDHNEQLQTYRWLANHATKATRWCEKEGVEKELPGVLEDFGRREYKHLGVYYIDPDKVKPLEVRKAVQVQKRDGKGTKPAKVPDVWSNAAVEAMLFPRYERLSRAFQEYEATGKLPPMPAPFDMVNSFEHRYSPTADTCIRRWVEEERKKTA